MESAQTSMTILGRNCHLIIRNIEVFFQLTLESFIPLILGGNVELPIYSRCRR